MASLQIGIVGLPNVGKSTLFNALTKSDILAANYPFATIEPNVGVVEVPDPRLKELAKLYQGPKIIPASIKFLDIAGLVAGASKGEGLGNQFLANIREVSAIAHVVRAFENNDIAHVNSSVDPKRDIEIINTELALADLQTLEKRLPRLEKEARGNPKLRPDADLAQKCLEILNNGEPLSQHPEIIEAINESDNLKDLSQLLTTKPVIYVFNVDEDDLTDQEMQSKLKSLVAPADCIFINAQMESDLKDLDEDEANELLESVGITEPGLHKLIKAAYHTLGLQSYLTAGDKEVRAWTIKQGSTAPQAAGVIHGDFERGFIAAQIVNYDDLISAGSEASAKAAGKVRTEGKTYLMQDGDVVEFRFNV